MNFKKGDRVTLPDALGGAVGLVQYVSDAKCHVMVDEDVAVAIPHGKLKRATPEEPGVGAVLRVKGSGMVWVHMTERSWFRAGDDEGYSWEELLDRHRGMELELLTPDETEALVDVMEPWSYTDYDNDSLRVEPRSPRGAVVRFTILSGAVDMRIADVPDLITYLRSCVADSQ